MQCGTYFEPFFSYNSVISIQTQKKMHNVINLGQIKSDNISWWQKSQKISKGFFSINNYSFLSYSGIPLYQTNLIENSIKMSFWLKKKCKSCKFTFLIKYGHIILILITRCDLFYCSINGSDLGLQQCDDKNWMITFTVITLNSFYYNMQGKLSKRYHCSRLIN